MKKFIQTSFILISFLLLPFFVKADDKFPDFPMTFYGTAQYNSSLAPIGSKIRAVADGTTIGEVEIKTTGVYGTSSPVGPNLSVNKFTGSSISFYYIVSGGIEPLQNVLPIVFTTNFVSGGTKELNLNFVTVNNNSSSGSSGGGGGGGGGSSNVVYCSDVAYSAWSECNGALQFRNILVKMPTSCTLTTSQQISLQQNCDVNVATSSVDSKLNVSENSVILISNGVNKSTSTSVSTGTNLVNNILSEALTISSSNSSNLTNSLGVKEDLTEETKASLKYKKILNSDKSINQENISVINKFIVYGTQTTKVLGEGERAGVVNSYFQAYNKLQDSEDEWADVLKIAKGRWPGERNIKSENLARIEFKKVYGREANIKNNIDVNAIMVMTYGLLPTQRNLSSEKTATKTFKWVYDRTPNSALDWNIVRAIAYSGDKR